MIYISILRTNRSKPFVNIRTEILQQSIYLHKFHKNLNYSTIFLELYYNIFTYLQHGK